MKKQPKPPRPWWRRVLRVCFWLLLILLTPVVCFVAYNRIDEAPSALAQRFENLPSRQMADADNGWLAMAGLGAPDGTDPLAWGRRKVDAYNAHLEARLNHAAEMGEFQPAEDAYSFQKAPDAPVDQVSCPMRDVDCLHWVLEHASQLEWMRENNATLLQRFEALMQMRGWEPQYLPAMDTPMLGWSMPMLHLDLLALDLANAQAHHSSAETSAVLQKLAGTVAFWQRVRSQPQDAVGIAVSGKLIERAYWIGNAWLDQASTEQIVAQGSTLDPLFAPAPEPVSWEGAIAHEYQGFRNTMSETIPGLGTVALQCLSGSTRDGCFKALGMSAVYAPQATLNLKADGLEQTLRTLEASPSDYARVSDEAGQVLERQFPQFDDMGALLSQMSYNFGGRVLAAISIPAFDWGLREHDRDALRRMIELKLVLREGKVRASDLATGVPNQDDSLMNPLTGLPFDWDAEHGAFWFHPSAKQDWKRDRVEVTYAD